MPSRDARCWQGFSTEPTAQAVWSCGQRRQFRLARKSTAGLSGHSANPGPAATRSTRREEEARHALRLESAHVGLHAQRPVVRAAHGCNMLPDLCCTVAFCLLDVSWPGFRVVHCWLHTALECCRMLQCCKLHVACCMLHIGCNAHKQLTEPSGSPLQNCKSESCGAIRLGAAWQVRCSWARAHCYMPCERRDQRAHGRARAMG